MTTTTKQPITRRTLLAASATVPLCAILTRRASAAEFNYKLATGQDPTHPVNVRAQEAIDRIREATGGKLEISCSRPTSSARTPTCSPRCARRAFIRTGRVSSATKLGRILKKSRASWCNGHGARHQPGTRSHRRAACRLSASLGGAGQLSSFRLLRSRRRCWSSPRSLFCSPASWPATSSTSRSSGRMNWPACCSSGWPCWARSSPSSAASTCA